MRDDRNADDEENTGAGPSKSNEVSFPELFFRLLECGGIMEAGVWWQAEQVPHTIVAIRLALELASCASCLGALWCHRHQKPTHPKLAAAA